MEKRKLDNGKVSLLACFHTSDALFTPQPLRLWGMASGRAGGRMGGREVGNGALTKALTDFVHFLDMTMCLGNTSHIF